MLTEKHECETWHAEIQILLQIFPELRTELSYDEIGRRWSQHDVAITTESYCLKCGRHIPGRGPDNQVCCICQLERGPIRGVIE